MILRRALITGAAAAALVTVGGGSALAAKRPDLVVSRLSHVPPTIHQGSAFKVEVAVVNKGKRKAGASQTRFYASVDRERDSTDKRLGGRSKVPKLRSGRRATSRPKLKLKDIPASKRLYLVACADSRRQVKESNERNNCRASSNSFKPKPPITSLDLINAALDRGEITTDQASLLEMKALAGYPKLRDKYRAPMPKGLEGATPSVFADIDSRWGSLSQATKAKLDAYLRPPGYEGASLTDPQGASTAKLDARAAEVDAVCQRGVLEGPAPDIQRSWDHIDTEHFRLWYYKVHHLGFSSPKPGHPLWELNDDPVGSRQAARRLAEVAEHVYDAEVGLFQRAPLSDAGLRCNGGDARIDVYAVNNSASFIGGQVVAYPPWPGIHRPGWMWISPGLAATDHGAQALFAHEFNHLIQLAYEYAPVKNRDRDYLWLEEASANWAVDYVYPHNNYEHSKARWYLRECWRSGCAGWIQPLEAYRWRFDSWNGYEDYLFFFYLTHRSGNPGLMRAIWQNTERYSSVEAVDAAIGGGFRHTWPSFAQYNLNRSDLAKYRQWDGIDDQIELDGSESARRKIDLDGEARRSIQLEKGQVPHLATNYRIYAITDRKVKKLTFRDFGFWSDCKSCGENGGSPSTDPHLAVNAYLELVNGSTRVEDWTGRDEVGLCLENPSENVESVVLIYTNSHPDDALVDEHPNASGFPYDSKEGRRPEVKASRVCKFPREWTGTASGQLTRESTHESDVTKWSATYTMSLAEENDRFLYYDGIGTVTWSTSGSTDYSNLQCTRTGRGTHSLSGLSYLLLRPEHDHYYDASLRMNLKGPGTERETCTKLDPDRGWITTSHTRQGYPHVNDDEFCVPIGTYDKFPSTLQGSQTYSTGSGAKITCKWSMSATG